MTRIEYAQTLVDQGLDKATFTSLMEEYDNNQNLEKELGVAEETAGAAPQEEAVSTDSRLEDSLLEFQSSQNQFLNSVSPQTLRDGGPGEDEKKKTITTTAYDLQGLKNNKNFIVDDSLILTNDDGTKKEIESNILDVISIGDTDDELNKELLKNLIKFSDSENQILEDYDGSPTDILEFKMQMNTAPHYLRTNYKSFYDNIVGFVKTDQQRKALQGETEVTTLIDLPGDKDMKGLVPKKFTNDFAYIPILSTAEGLKKYNESGSNLSTIDYLLENGEEGVDYNKGATRVFNNEEIENTYNSELRVPGGSLKEGEDLPTFEINELTDNAVVLDPLTLEKEAESIQQDLDKWSQKYTEDYLKTLSPEDRLKAIGERENLLLDLQNNSAQLINIGIGLQVVEDINISVAQYDPDINNFLGGGITKDENGKYVIKETTKRQYSGGGISPLTSEDITNKDNTLSNVIYKKGERRGLTPERGFVKDFQRYFGYNGLAADFEYNVLGKNDIILVKNGVYNTTDGDVWWKKSDNAGRLNYAKTLEENGFSKDEIPESVSEQKALLIENDLMKVFQLGEDYETYGPAIEEALNWAEENKSDTRQTVRENGFSMYETYTALKTDKQLIKKSKQLADQSLTIMNSVKKRLDSEKTQNAINGLENWQNNILENEKYILDEYKTHQSSIKQYNEDIASDDLKIQELNKEYEEKLAQAKLQMEDASTNISGKKAIEEQERVIKEFEDYVNYDYRTKFEELEYNIQQNIQDRDSTIEGYDSIYADYVQQNEEYQSKYNEAKDLLQQLDVSIRQDLQEVAIYQNYLGILEYQINQEGRDLEKLYTGAGQGNLLSPIWNSFATSFTESVGGSTIILTDVARGINQLDKLSSDISSYVKHSSGLISDKEYQDELEVNETVFQDEKRNLAASRRNVPMQVQAAASQLKDMGIDPEYAEWYASTWIGGTVTTLADMVGAYMGTPMAGSFGGGIGLGVGFFKKSLVRSQDKINGMKASYISKYMKDNGVGYQEGLKAFNETFSENKQMGYAYAQAIVEGTLSYVGGRILGGTLQITPRLVNGLTNQVLAQFATKGGGKITTQELQNAIYRRVSKMIGDKWSRRVFNVTGKTLGGGTDELLEETSQEFGAIFIDKVFETYWTEGIDFDIPDITSQEFKNNMVHLAKISFTLGGLSGMVRGAAMKDAKVISDWDAMSLSQRVQAENFLSIYANANRSVEQYKQERARVQSKFMSDPNFTKEMRDNELAALDANHKIWQEINPSLTGRAQNDIHALMKMKQRLEDGVVGNINDAQNKNIKNQIDNINEQIEKVVDNEDNYRRSFDDKTAIEAQQDIGQRIMDRRGGGKITFANDQGSFEQAIDESGIAGQEFDNEGNLIQDNTQADALYAMDGSGNIVVNLDRMKDLSSISAVTHEIFHEITEDQLAGMSEQERDALVEDFKKLLSRTERAAVQTRLDLNYNGDMSTSIEWLNAFHDAIVLGNLKYRPGLANKAGNWIVNNLIKPFAPTAFKEDLSFDSAKGVYNFLKKYSLQTKEMMEGSRQDFSDEIGEVVYTKQNTEDKAIREMPESLRAAASRSNIQGVANTANVDLNNNSQVRKFAEDLISRDKDGNIVSDIKQSVLFDEFGGVFEDITKLTYDNQTRNRPVDPETGRQSELLFTREEYKDALGALSVQLLQNEFVNENLGAGQSIDDFLRNRLYLRGYAFPSELGIVSETVTAPEPDLESTPDEKQVPQFFLKDRLGETASEVDTKMKKEAAKLSTKDVNTTYKQTPKLAFKETVGMFMSDPNAVYESGPSKGEKILDSIIDKIENNKDLNQQDIKMLQPFINKNADALISSLAEGATPSGKSTGIQNVLLREFYTKTQRAKMAKTGSKQGLPIQVKNQIDKKDFLDLFGITPTGEANIRNINKSSQAMKALVVQTNRIMSNQAIRSVRKDFGKLGEGRSRSMRSQSGVSLKNLADNKPLNSFFQGTEFTGSDFNSYGANWNLLVKQLGLKPLNSNNPKDIKEFEDFIVDKLISKLPYEFFANGTLLGAGAANVKIMKEVKLPNGETKMVPIYFEKNGKKEKLRKYFLKDGSTILNSDPNFDKIKGSLRAKGSFFIPNAVRMKELLDRKAKEIAQEKNISIEEAFESMFAKPNPNIDAALSRVDYTTGTGAKRQLNEEFFSDVFGSKEFKKFNDQKLDGLKDIFKIFEDLIKDDKKNAKYVAAILSTTSGNMNHFVRIAAPVKFYDNSIVTEGGIIVEEHTLPATLVSQYLFASAVKGKVDSNFKNIKRNYFQGALSKTNDLKLKGDGFNYTAKTPDGWSLDGNVWARYFNENVGANNGGINPSDIKLEDGQTVAELFDVDVKGVKQTPDLTQYQNTLIEQKIEDPKLNTKGPMASFSKISNDKQSAKLNTESNIEKSGVAYMSNSMTTQQVLDKARKIDEALTKAKGLDQPVRKIRVFDFDDTLATSKSQVFYSKPNTTGKPSPKRKAIFMIGGPGSGKTNIGKGLKLGRQGFKVVNQDIFIETEKAKAGLPENEKEYNKKQRSQRAKIGAAGRKAAQEKLSKYTKAGDGMVIDGTGASYNATMKKVNALKEEGYEVFMVYAKTSDEVAQERNKARKERSLPEFIVDRTQKSVNENVPKYKEDLGDNFVEIDTETIEYNKPLPEDFVKVVNEKINATERGVLSAEEFAEQGADLVDQGYAMDFSDFNIVREGARGPLFEIAEKIRDARGTDDVFVLTARAPQSAEAIHAFLKSEGLDIPLENITGLGNSTGEAKANWIIDKAAEGYNDFYFADDATANVAAVKKALDVIDVKSKVQQARKSAMMSSSKGLSDKFNKFLEASTGVEYYKTFSDAKAKVLSKDKFKFFIPASAEDFLGLLYTTLAKGKQGEEQLNFYKETLIKPYSQAMSNLMTDQVQLMDDFKKLKKKLKVPKDLRKTTNSGFTNEQAVRVYLYTAEGHDVPGLSNRDLTELLAVVENNPDLKVFAEQILSITKGDGYVKPDVNWLAGTITTDLVDLLKTTKRPKYLETWQANVDAIFSKENLNKLESIYGSKYVEALKNIIGRMKTGSNRAPSTDRLTNAAMDWLNGSIGTIMFFNMRSALLQGISTTNFMNWTFNNPARMGKALANVPQFAKDFLYLINSDYLVARRNGLKLNISESEIADAAKTSKNKAKAIINYIIEKGYLPTKFMDSFAIASGGATFYRNRINDLIKNEGKTEAEAEAQAFEEFMQKSEESQQSSDPSRISQQQTTLMGRLLLQFVNTPMQYARLQKRSFQDLVSGRGDAKEHIGKIMYYGVIQNLWFNAMQQGLFLLGFGDDEEEEDPRKDKKIFNTVNGMFDSILRGLGLGGMLTSVIKNFGIDIYDRTQKARPEYVDAWIELLQVSPSIRKKLTNIKNAGYAFDSKKKRQEILDKGFSIDNPAFMALAQVLNTATNVPLDRVLQKAINIQEAFAEETTAWEMIFMLSGWPSWDVKPEKSKQETKTIVVDGKLIEVPKTTKRKEQQPWWKEKEKKKPVVRKRIISE